ncbi:MAG: NifB/NifX family molybdenum-iron cluster-binding protein [Bryobacteraceae bacterium]
MRIAIPVENGRLAQHFGHASHFALFDVDPESNRVLSAQVLSAPPHAPGLLPAWLKELDVHVVIAGGMGPRAVSLLEANAMEVIPGAPVMAAQTLVEQYLAGSLRGGQNHCNHAGSSGHGHACRGDSPAESGARHPSGGERIQRNTGEPQEW